MSGKPLGAKYGETPPLGRGSTSVIGQLELPKHAAKCQKGALRTLWRIPPAMRELVLHPCKAKRPRLVVTRRLVLVEDHIHDTTRWGNDTRDHPSRNKSVLAPAEHSAAAELLHKVRLAPSVYVVLNFSSKADEPQIFLHPLGNGAMNILYLQLALKWDLQNRWQQPYHLGSSTDVAFQVWDKESAGSIVSIDFFIIKCYYSN